jgi:hypothetical protein
MRLKKQRSKALEFNERDKLVLFLVRMDELTNRKYYKEIDWKVTPKGLSLRAADDDTFAAFLLSFRHFYANDSPTEMGKIHGILSKVAHTVNDAGTLAELAKIKVEFAKGPVFRFDVFDTKGTVIEKFDNDQIFDLYINCRYFHTDPRGAEFFFKMPEPSRTTCYHAFQMALIRYVRRFHAYVPIIMKFLSSSALPPGRFDVNPANRGQAILVVNVPKCSPV